MKKELPKFPGVKDSKPEVPKDLGVKIGTKDEELWTRVRDVAKKAVEDMRESLLVQKGIMEYAQSRINQEINRKV